jgi:hypothetical protein
MKVTFCANFEKATKFFHFGLLALNLVLHQHIRSNWQQKDQIKEKKV